MDFAFATDPSPGHPNEDYLLLSADFVILLDGVSPLPGLDSGCVHGPRWLVRALGGHLARTLSNDATVRLDRALADAIRAVRASHAGTCDLSNPHSPSSTLAVVRERAGYLDYLVLCDSAVVFDNTDGVLAVTDDRTATLPAYDRDTVARLRNRPGGFWVASTAPEAAEEAVTGTVPLDRVRRLMLCTDGVSRLVVFFGRDWSDVLDLVTRQGPRAAIEAVREHETRHPDRLARPGRRTKRHDDATLAVRSG